MNLPGARVHYDFTRDPFCSSVLDFGGRNTAVPTTKNLAKYNPVTWSEWVVDRELFTADSSGLDLFADGETNFFHLDLECIPQTNYGFLYNIVSTDLNNIFGISTTGAFSMSGEITKNIGCNKYTLTTLSEIVNNKLRLYLSGGNNAGTHIKIKDVRLFELPTGSQIEADFTNLTAAQLDEKYTYIPNKRCMLKNGMNWVPNGLYFSGSSYCSIQDNEDADIKSSDKPFIFGAVFNIDTSMSSSGFIISKNLSEYNDGQYSFYYDDSNSSLTSFVSGQYHISLAPIEKGKFYFVFYIINATKSELYINGFLDSYVNKDYGVIDNKPNFNIGGRSLSKDGRTVGLGIKGIISETFVCQGTSAKDIINWFIQTGRPEKYGIRM